MGKGERLDAVTRLAQRRERERMRTMYGYYNDGSGWAARPTWQSYQMLFRAQVCVGGYHLGQSYQIDAVQSPGECSSGEWGGDGRPI